MPGEKTNFLLRNLLRGIAWLAVLIFVFILIKRNIKIDYLVWLEPILDNTSLVFIVYFLSELFFGIIPPEIFMLWALRQGDAAHYTLIVGILAVISYACGFAGYLFGSYLQNTRLYRLFRTRVLRRYEAKLRDYGLYLIIAAAATPIPFSGIAMLSGAIGYPYKKYIIYSLTRFLRYGVYAFIIWKAGMI